MKKCIYILSIISIIGCAPHENKKQLDKKDKEELMMDSKILNSFPFAAARLYRVASKGVSFVSKNV